MTDLGARGHYNYRQYRGKPNKAKIALAVFLMLVILAAVAVILLQRNIVYDETGTPHIELPWQENAVPEDAEAPPLELVIEATPDPQPKKTPEDVSGKMPEEPVSEDDSQTED